MECRIDARAKLALPAGVKLPMSIFAGFRTHTGAMDLRIEPKVFSLGPIFAVDAASPTGFWRKVRH